MAFATNILSSAVGGRRSLKLTTAALPRRDTDGRSGVEVVEFTVRGDDWLRPVLGVVLEEVWGEGDSSVAGSGVQSVFCWSGK